MVFEAFNIESTYLMWRALISWLLKYRQPVETIQRIRFENCSGICRAFICMERRNFPLNFAFVVAKYLVKSQLVLSFKSSLCPKVFDKHLSL